MSDDHPDREPSTRSFVPQSVREFIRKTAADLAAARPIPRENFPGHKEIYCANLEGVLGSHTLRLLDAYEALEAERGEPDTHWVYIVCHAPGYPDPYMPHPNTLEEAVKFASKRQWNHATNEPATPVIKRRLVSDWEEVTT